jgi:YesN/AraC family two-component response regulator
MNDSINILVVDDEAIIREVLEKILKKGGFSVTTVGSGSLALNYLKSYRVDLLITDIKMPKMSGLELLKEVKLRFPEVAVIVMTAFGDSYAVKDALLTGADEYITKPFKADELSLIIERVTWRFQLHQEPDLPLPVKSS